MHQCVGLYCGEKGQVEELGAKNQGDKNQELRAKNQEVKSQEFLF